MFLGLEPWDMDQETTNQFTAVRLTRKFAEAIDGVDLSHSQVGDRLELSHRDARMLIAEGWASPCERTQADDNGNSAAAAKVTQGSTVES